VLLSNRAHRNLSTICVDDYYAKDSLAEEDSLGMMPKGAMPKVGKERLRLIKPLVNG